MTAPAVRITTGSLVRAVLIVVAWAVLLVVAHRARTDLIWFVEAAVIAVLAAPLVAVLERHVPRWLAIIGLSGAALTLAALVGFVVFAEMRAEATELRARAPAAAQELEANGVVGSAARTFDAGDRLTSFADHLADRFTIDEDELTGLAADLGSRAAVVVVVWILTLMLLAGGRALWTGTLAVLSPERQAAVDDLVRRAYGRAVRHLGLLALRALVVGTVTFAVAEALALEAPFLLASWAALWALVPGFGIVVASTLVAVLALADSTGAAVGVLVGAAVLQVVDDVVVQNRIDDATVRVGAFVTLVAGLVGFRVYGPGGAVVALVLAVIALSIVDDLGAGRDVEALAPTTAPDPAPPIDGPTDR